VISELDALVEGGHVTQPQAAAQGGLADEHDGQGRAAVEVVVGHHADGF
jgi:hypothetical protein